jgi:hypothetical protein
MNMKSKFDLVRWETPFTDARGPSVTLLPDPGGLVSLVVSPDGIDCYPKYLVEFNGDVVAYREEDESFPPVPPAEIRSDPSVGCAYLWAGSPWLRQYEQWHEYFEQYLGGELRHFIVSGGDFIVEILAVGEPVISEIPGPRVFQVSYQA